MKQNLTKFFNLIKNDKQAKTLTIIGVVLLFIFTLGYSLSAFTGGKSANIANIKVNDLSFNITTNGGTSDDRILHLQAGKNEIFNVVITNLNKISAKYELIYDVCSDSKCSSLLDSLPSGVKVEFMTENSDELNGLINNSNETKKINLLTTNNTSSDVYIRLNLNAGYEWNDLELANQIKEYSKITDIIAYVDGVEVKDYPSTCRYSVEAKAYKSNHEITLNDLKVECDKTTKLWKTSYTGFADKIEIKFKYNVPSFATDSWEEIAEVVRDGDLTAYQIGSEKEVEIDGTNYTVRVANNTTPDECNQDDFSETACGFVVEFVDIIETRPMNSARTNNGGWSASDMRTYANGEFFNKLPSDLKNVIVETKVISGHGSTSGETNYNSIDKIYLLATHEIREDVNNESIALYDTAYNNTRQLDYYKNKEVTTKNYAAAIKQYNGSNSLWWTRSPDSRFNIIFYDCTADGYSGSWYADSVYGFAPAFRIG